MTLKVKLTLTLSGYPDPCHLVEQAIRGVRGQSVRDVSVGMTHGANGGPDTVHAWAMAEDGKALLGAVVAKLQSEGVEVVDSAIREELFEQQESPIDGVHFGTAYGVLTISPGNDGDITIEFLGGPDDLIGLIHTENPRYEYGARGLRRIVIRRASS
jgi:hypothetical protein